MKNPNFEEYNWFDDPKPITEQTIKNKLQLLKYKQCIIIILKLRNRWFDETLSDFLAISPNKTTNS